MVNPVILSNEKHKDLKVIPARGAEYGENIHIAPVSAHELNKLVADFAIFFVKDTETGQFRLNALLGFEPGENLYLQANGWQSIYLPRYVEYQPFMVSESEKNEETGKRNAVIAIDLDSPRIHEGEGVRLFDEQGNNTDFLNYISDILVEVLANIETTKKFIEALLELDLIRSTPLNAVINGKKRRYDGLYTIDSEKLQAIEGETLSNLHKKNYLQACHLILGSTGHLEKLTHWKNLKESA